MEEALGPFHVPQQSRRHKLRFAPSDEFSLLLQQPMPPPQPPHTSPGGLNLSLSTYTRSSAASSATAAYNPSPVGPFTGYALILARSRFLRPAQELLEDFCRGSGVSSDEAASKLLEDSGTRFGNEEDDISRRCNNPSLLSLLHEVYKRYRLYCQQMHSAVASFESVAGLANAAPFVCFAIKAVFRHFHCLKTAILDHIRVTSKGFGSVNLGKGTTSHCFFSAKSLNYTDVGVWRPNFSSSISILLARQLLLEERENMQETHHQEERDQLPATKMAAAAANGGKSGDGVEDDMKIMQVHDSSLDYKGNLPLRASTGSWRASFFIIAIEFSERLSYFGIATNMINYMTKVMHQDLETAANSVNIWTGVTTVTPLLGGFLADAYLGRYSVILLSALLYVLGLGLLTMTQYIPSLKPCGSSLNLCERATNVHQVVFFVSAYLLSLATGGYKPCLESFGADQFDNNDSKERKQKMSFFNWWNVSLCFGLFLGSTLIVYLQDNVGWGVAFLILCIIMVVTVFVFILGRPIYRYRAPQGSPLTPMFQALIASMAKRKLDYPSDPAFLYEVPKSEKATGTRLSHTNGLRFLDKAAIVEYTNGEAGEKKRNPWRLATVTQVEELKLVINMVPIWLTSLVFGIGIAQSATFFVKQANAMNRRVFNRFEIPAASVYTLTAIGMMSSVAFYDRVLLPYLRKATGNERGITILKRIGIGMVFLITSMVLSAMVERKRLNAFTKGKQVISVFWLVPQFLIMGIGDGFSLVGMQEYFYDQVPDSMRSLGMAFYLSVIGVGSFLSSFLITLVDSITGKNGGKRWIGKDVNHSRLDYYYCLLAVICTLNIFVFVCITKNYSYKVVEKSVDASVREDNKGNKGQESLA